MAKFGVIVCILLVACGTQGNLFSSITKIATSALTSVINEATDQVTTIQATVDSLANTVTNVADSIASAVSNATTEYTNEVQIIVDNVSSDVDVTPCLSLFDDFEEVAEEIGNTAVAAINDLQITLEARCTVILADLQNLTSIATSYLEELDSCAASIKNFLSCIALRHLIPSMTNFTSTVWNTISADIKSLNEESSSFTNFLPALNIITCVERLKSAQEKSIAEVKECVITLTTLP